VGTCSWREIRPAELKPGRFRHGASVPFAVKMVTNSRARLLRLMRGVSKTAAKGEVHDLSHASRVLLGRYMGLMRYLKPRQKALVRKIREAKGVRAAIAKARKLAQPRAYH
jgi:hypothetical protein